MNNLKVMFLILVFVITKPIKILNEKCARLLDGKFKSNKIRSFFVEKLGE